VSERKSQEADATAWARMKRETVNRDLLSSSSKGEEGEEEGVAIKKNQDITIDNLLNGSCKKKTAGGEVTLMPCGGT
jgi:hypothetical protein